MEQIHLTWDKVVLILSGFFIAFIWPGLIARQIRNSGLSGRALANVTWFRSFGIVLMVLGIILLFLGL